MISGGPRRGEMRAVAASLVTMGARCLQQPSSCEHVAYNSDTNACGTMGYLRKCSRSNARKELLRGMKRRCTCWGLLVGRSCKVCELVTATKHRRRQWHEWQPPLHHRDDVRPGAAISIFSRPASTLAATCLVFIYANHDRAQALPTCLWPKAAVQGQSSLLPVVIHAPIGRSQFFVS